MHIKRMHDMVEKLTERANAELSKGMDYVDATEMEKVACIIKELAEAEYYSKISKAMDEYEEEPRYYDDYRYKRTGRFAPKGKGSYMPRHYEDDSYRMSPNMYREYPPEYYRDMDRNNGKMYYTETSNSGSTHNSNDGKSWYSRRGYMETKENHKNNTTEDKQQKLKSLEHYAKELTEDVVEMVADMTAEEKSLLKAKLQTLAQRI